MTRTRKAIVGGGGVAGLAAAWQLRQLGWQVEVHEASDALGGMLAPVAFRGIDCDVGAHRLHPEAMGEPLLRALAAQVPFEARPRVGRILLGGKQFAYPLSLPGLLAGLGVERAVRCAGDLLRQRARFRAWEAERGADAIDQGYEAFVLRRAGRSAYEAFYRPYAEKVWGLPPSELSQTAAKQRVSSSRPLRAALTRQASTFLYPRGGMAALLGALERLTRAAGVVVHTGRPLDLARADADAVLHAGHFGDVVGARDTWSHRGLYLVYLAVPLPHLGPVDTWYAPESRWWFGRVSDVRRFSPDAGHPDETVLCCEIPEGRWGQGRDFVADLPVLVEQLQAAGILPPGVAPVAATQRYVPSVYPLYRRGWVPAWRQALADLAARDARVLPIGRQGLYLHCNVDHALATAQAAVQHLAGGGDGATWPQRAEAFLGLRVRD